MVKCQVINKGHKNPINSMVDKGHWWHHQFLLDKNPKSCGEFLFI